MQFPWRSRSLEDQISEGVEREFERYRRRCEELRGEFLERVKLRDEALEEMEATEAEIQDLQGRGVSLLGEMNDAMLKSDERPMKNVRSRHEAFSRELGRAQSKKDRLARRLSEIEFDEREAARELAQAGEEQLEEARARAEELRNFLEGLLETRRNELSETVRLLDEEHEARSGSRDPDSKGSESSGEEWGS